MPTFEYQARDSRGKLISGRRLSNSSDSLGAQLLNEGVVPVSIVEIKSTYHYWDRLEDLFRRGGVNLDELGLFARQMHTLCKTGVPITIAIKQLAEFARSPRLVEALHGLVERLESGQDLASAMDDYPNIFPPLMVTMIRIGLNTGRLDEAFLHLSQYIEMESGTVKKVSATLRYPLFVLISIIIGVVLVNIYVIPTFANVYQRANIELPWFTTFIIQVSKFFTKEWFYIFLGVFIIVVGTYSYLKSPEGKLAWSRNQLRLPVIGGIIKRVILMRFAQTFALTIYSGVPLLEGLQLVSSAIKNPYASHEIDTMREAVKRGSSLTQAAHGSDLFTPLELQMLAVSEETGDLAPMLEQIANFYRSETVYDLKRINDIVEPILIIILALFILLLALAVYLPVWNMVKLVH